MEMSHELEPALALAKNLAPEQLPHFLGELEAVRVTALARIAEPASEAKPDQLVDVGRAATRLGCSKGFLYHNHKRFPFARRIGRRLLFSSVGLDSYLKKTR